MSTKNHKFNIATLLTVLALLILVGARAVNASAAQLNLGDDSRNSSESASVSGDRRSGEVEFIGVVEAIDAQTWTISGQTVFVGPGVEVKGAPVIGDQVKVHAFLAQDGSLVAREIGASTAVMGDNSNANADDNSNANGDDNGNINDDNSNANDDNGNTSGDDNGNINDDDGNANDDNGNTSGDDNGNSNDDNGNDSGHDNNNGNDDHGGGGKDG